MEKNVFEKSLEMLRENRDLVLVTVVDTAGSAPAEIGAKMIVTASDVEGTVGGGALEKEIIDLARDLLKTGGTGRLYKKDVGNLDMNCGGAVTLFLEPFKPKNRLFIFGGGHIARALTPLAAGLGFGVTVVDNRSQFADKKRFPNAAEVILSQYDEATKLVAPGSFVVIVTHGHAHDEEVLKEMIKLEPPLPYIGMIGSRNKVLVTLDKLKGEGLKPGLNLYSPIGLNLGGGSPNQIAVSIASELLGVLNKKEGLPHLRERLD